MAKGWRQEVRGYLSFRRGERRGILLLLLLLACVWLVPFIWAERPQMPAEIPVARYRASLDSLSAASRNDDSEYPYRSYGKSAGGRGRASPSRPDPSRFFAFDPNTATPEDWRRMGIPAHTVRTIGNYLGKGGRFRRPEDLYRVYGLSGEFADALMPFVRIPGAGRSDSRDGPEREGRSIELPEKRFGEGGAGRREKPPIPMVSVNGADSAAWERLPGIGPRLASRILRFRERLGGFMSVAQVGETFGLPDSTFRSILPYLTWDPPASPAGIDINHATREQMAQHPYVSFRLAYHIEAYRIQHGPFRRAEDLQRIALVTPEVYSRIAPYLMVRE